MKGGHVVSPCTLGAIASACPCARHLAPLWNADARFEKSYLAHFPRLL